MANELIPPTPAVPAAQPVASPAPAGQPPAPAPQPSAASTAPLFGGLRSGRERKDGRIPGSPEALAADREKERLRKAEYRKRTSVPAPLPSAGQAAASPVKPVAGPQGGVPVPAPSAPVAVPWKSEDLSDLCEQVLPCLEELAQKAIVSRAEKARLDKEVIDEIEADCAWPKPAKKALSLALPQLLAKRLNQSGISADNAPEVIVGTALVGIGVSTWMVLRRLNELAAKTNVATAKGPEAKPEEKPA